MKPNKSILAAVFVLIIAGVTSMVLLRQPGSPAPASAAGTRADQRGAPEAGTNSASTNPDATQSSAARSRGRQASPYTDLIARYGEARTNLSKHVAGNITGIMDDAVAMGEMMVSAQGSGFGGGLGMALGRLNGELELTPDQRERAAALFKEYQLRQTASARTAAEQLKKDPTPLMQLVLASDASSRGEMSDDEYRQTQAEVGKNLTGIINPLDRKNFGGGSPLRDTQFVAGLKGILDPGQAQKLDTAMSQRQAEAAADPGAVPGVQEGNIAGLPKMELEKLDKSIESARKVTTGIKSMMDGMSGLREANPQPDQ